jgi:hypothetical protein
MRKETARNTYLLFNILILFITDFTLDVNSLLIKMIEGRGS